LGCNTLLIEGGAATAAAFLRDGLVDRLMLYRAPILLGAGKACLNDIGLTQLQDAHGIWQLSDARSLGKDRLEVYEKTN
jgi:diaminohydroxyphosphoribosylaminopyrimidine deaminase/5-amino-6-(5-phosphoribosylamino)uracil reductase